MPQIAANRENQRDCPIPPRTDAVERVGFLLCDRDTRAGRLTNVALYVLNTVFVGLYVVSTYPLSPATLPALAVVGSDA